MEIINNINSSHTQLVINRADRSSDPLIRQTNGGDKAAISQDDTVIPTQHEISHHALGQRYAIDESLHRVAMSIRVADGTMKTIGDHIQSMRSQLDVMIKHYPPFLTGSPERIRALRSFSAFRKEIEALTIPPQDQGAAKIMADPGVFPPAGNQDVVVNASGTRRTIPSQQVHTGPSGLNIPVLNDAATDDEIHAAIKSLDRATATLEQRRSGLSRNAADLIPISNVSSTVAEHKSVELGKLIAQEPSRGFTNMLPLLSQMA